MDWDLAGKHTSIASGSRSPAWQAGVVFALRAVDAGMARESGPKHEGTAGRGNNSGGRGLHGDARRDFVCLSQLPG